MDRVENPDGGTKRLRTEEPGDAPSLSAPAGPSPRRPGLPEIPGYRLIERLGGGGMGDVYLAEDEALGRQVAVKAIALSGGWDEGESRERLVREARAMASLSHPHLVQVHTLARHENRDYLIMELVRGGTLEDRIQCDGALPTPKALILVRQVSEALEAAWGRGIIHRDIKPSNILIDERGGAKVADFGLAKPLDSEESLRITQTGTVLGTPCYMSPEQAGEGEVDFRTDIYALGLVLYEMLTGRPPFEKMGFLTVVARHIAGDLPDLAAARSELPKKVVELYRWMTARNPELRPSSYAVLRQEIDSIFAVLREPEARAEPQAAQVVRKTRPWMLWIGAVAIVIGLVGGGFAGWWMFRSQTPPNVAPPPPNPPPAVQKPKPPRPRPLALADQATPDTPASTLEGVLAGLATGAFGLRLDPVEGQPRQLQAMAARKASLVLFVLRENGDVLCFHPPDLEPVPPIVPGSPLRVELPDAAAPGWVVLIATPEALPQPILLGARPEADHTIYPQQVGTREPAYPAFEYLSRLIEELRTTPGEWDAAVRPL